MGQSGDMHTATLFLLESGRTDGEISHSGFKVALNTFSDVVAGSLNYKGAPV